MRAERRTFWFVLMPAVAVTLIVAVVVGAVIRDGDDGESAGASGRNARTVAPQTLLLGHRGADGRMDLLILVGTGPKSASTLLLPVATQVEVPSLGPQTLADLPNDGDQSLVQTTVENLLGVKVAKTLVLDDAGLTAALQAAAPFTVDLHREVQFEGSSEGIVAAGQHHSSSADAARLLVARQSGSELDRLVTVQDVLDAWSRRLRTASVARATLRAQPGLAALIGAANTTDRRTDTLPVESVTTGGTERFDPRNADVARYAAAAFPDALLAVGGKRPRVEILNGTGAVGLAQSIAGRIVPAGGQVTLTGNVQNFGLRNTQVVFYRKADRAVAQRLLRALGCGALKQADTEIGVVDVTILAGADCFQTGAAPGP
ncbi:MAG: LCP family protein [Acidimicrobiia bacterium]